jgi:DNA helicase-2/ATP-dependent DNA helicase PcrA
MALSMNLDAYQQKAVDATDSKVLVIASPGSGKTRVTVSRLEYMVETLKIDPRNIVLLTFTRYAAQEMTSRTSRKIGQSAYIGTIHAFALKIIKMEGQSRGWAPDYLSILDEEEAQAEEWTALQNTGLVDTKNNWKGFCNQHLWDRFKENKLSEKPLPTTFPEELKPKLNDAWKSFVDHLRAENALTFGMLLLEALAIVEANDDASKRLRMRFVHFLVDEAQDTDSLQFRFIYAFKPETLFFVGDLDQCQPSDTIIRMSDKSFVPIAHIKSGDKVMSYARHEKAVIKEAIVSRTAEREYVGNMYSITAGGHTARSTATHKWLIKWLSGQERTEYHWCTYIMRKGNYFRVGKTRFFRSAGDVYKKYAVIGLALRIRQENADAGWVLEIHTSEAEATAYEQVVAANYGLPEACFKAANNCVHFTQEIIDSIFERIPNQLAKAARCLQDHGRELSFPLFHREQVRSRRTVQEIEACNLISDVMCVPVYNENHISMSRRSGWEVLTVEHEWTQEKVYSLDIEKHHKYISNDIITCNSIYSWRGSRPDLLMKFSEGATIYKLPNSYRFGITIGDAANKLIKNNTNRIDMAIQAIAENKGTIQTVTDAKYSDVANIIMEQMKHHKPADIAVLARTHMVLDNLTRDMDRSRIPFTKIGGQFDVTKSKEFRVLKGALRLAYNRKDNRAFMAVSHLLGLEPLDLWDIRNRAAQSDRSFIEEYETIHKRNPFEMANISEVEPKLKDFKNYGAYQFGESLDYIDHICKREAIIKPEEVIHYVSLADIQDSFIDKSDTVKLLSAHASKGLEWPVVIVLGMSSGIWPSPRSVKEGNIEEERRILYVAISRAEQKLFLIQKLPAFRNESKPSLFMPEFGDVPEYNLQPKTSDDDLRY